MFKRIGVSGVLAIACVGAALMFFIQGVFYIGLALLAPPIFFAVRKALQRSAKDACMARTNFERLTAAGFRAHTIFEGTSILGVDHRHGRIVVADARFADIHSLHHVHSLEITPGDDGLTDLTLHLMGKDGEKGESFLLTGFASEEAAAAVTLVNRLAANKREEMSARTAEEQKT